MKQPYKPLSLYGITGRLPWLHQVLFTLGLALLLIAIAGRFFYLNAGEFTDWDESLYAWRAKVAVVDGKWLDQSDHSFGRFYSGSFPPLLIWQMAGMMSIFGFEEWAARLPSALHGAAALLAIFYIGYFFAGRGAGIFAACMAGSISYVLRFSRDAQFDMPYTAWMFIFTALYLWGMKHPDQRTRAVRLAGVAIGCGLMTKIAVPATAAVSLFLWQILLIFVALRLNDARWLNPLSPKEFSTSKNDLEAPADVESEGQKGQNFQSQPISGHAVAAAIKRYAGDHLVIFGYALVIWLPWHVYMLVKHGPAFTDSYIFEHLIGKNQGVQDFHDGIDDVVAKAAFFYPYSAWDRLPEYVYALAFVAIAAAIIWLIRIIAWGQTDQSHHGIHHSSKKGSASPPPVLSNKGGKPDPRRSILPGLWLGLTWIVFLGGGLQASATKREIYLIPLYCMCALMAALYLMYWLKTPSQSMLHAFLALGTYIFLALVGHSDNARSEFAWNIITGGYTLEPGHSHGLAVLEAMSIYLYPTFGLTVGILLFSYLLERTIFRRQKSQRVVHGILIGLILFCFSTIAIIKGAKGQFETDKNADRTRFMALKPYFNDPETWPEIAVVSSFENASPHKMYYLCGIIHNSLPLDNRYVKNLYDVNTIPTKFDKEARADDLFSLGSLDPYRKEGALVVIEGGVAVHEPSLSILMKELEDFQYLGDGGSYGLYFFFVYDPEAGSENEADQKRDKGEDTRLESKIVATNRAPD